MKRVFLLHYSDGAGTPDTVEQWADGSPLIDHWRYDLPHCIYLLSEANATDLSRSFLAASGRRGGFVIAEVAGQVAGLLPDATWDLLLDKKPLAPGHAEPELAATR